MKDLGREGRGKRGAIGSQRGRIRLLNLTEQSTPLGGSATHRFGDRWMTACNSIIQ